MDLTDLDGIPDKWKLNLLIAWAVFRAVGPMISSVRQGYGLKRIIYSFWLGENIPKVIAQDYKEELSTTKPVTTNINPI